MVRLFLRGLIEGGGGASLEFFSADLNTGELRPINDPSDPLAILAYSMPKVKRPYASISHIPNTVGVAANAPIQAQLTDQTAIVNQDRTQVVAGVRA